MGISYMFIIIYSCYVQCVHSPTHERFVFLAILLFVQKYTPHVSLELPEAEWDDAIEHNEAAGLAIRDMRAVPLLMALS